MPAGVDNGFSWANAYTDLQDALAEAKAGDQMWTWPKAPPAG